MAVRSIIALGFFFVKAAQARPNLWIEDTRPHPWHTRTAHPWHTRTARPCMAFRSHRGAACAQILRSRGQEGHRDDKKAMVCPFLGEPLLGSAGAAYHLTGSRGACCAAPFGGCTNRCLGGRLFVLSPASQVIAFHRPSCLCPGNRATLHGPCAHELLQPIRSLG